MTTAQTTARALRDCYDDCTPRRDVEAIESGARLIEQQAEEIASLKKLRHKLCAEVAKYSSEAGRRAGQMDAARIALLKIWPDGKVCNHANAREAFAALEGSTEGAEVKP